MNATLLIRDKNLLAIPLPISGEVDRYLKERYISTISLLCVYAAQEITSLYSDEVTALHCSHLLGRWLKRAFNSQPNQIGLRVGIQYFVKVLNDSGFESTRPEPNTESAKIQFWLDKLNAIAKKLSSVSAPMPESEKEYWFSMIPFIQLMKSVIIGPAEFGYGITH